MCVGAGKWCAERGPGVGRRPGPVGPAGRRARGGRQEARLHRRHHVRHGDHARPLLPARRRRPQRHPDRGGAGQALRQRDGLADRRRADPDPRRPRLRDRRLARRPRRAPGRGRADAARPADQPDLRGLHRDHAPADRPRGGRRAPRRSPATSSTRTPGSAARRRPARGPAASTPGGCPPSPSGEGQTPGAYAEFGPLAGAPAATSSGPSRKLARSTFYAMSRWQGKMERKQAFLGRVVDIGAELFAMSAVCVRATAERDTRPEDVELADLFCRQARLRVEALFAALWDNTDVGRRGGGEADPRRPVRRPGGGRRSPRRPTRPGWPAGRPARPPPPDVRRRIPRRDDAVAGAAAPARRRGRPAAARSSRAGCWPWSFHAAAGAAAS